MYHYVRKKNEHMPYFVYLDVENFEKQIDYLSDNYHILSEEEFETCINSQQVIENGMILTFDDAMVDHYEYVYPILKERKLWGIFYIPTFPYKNNKLLDVHRLHYILGRFGGERVLLELKKVLLDSDFLDDAEMNFQNKTYVKQTNDVYTKEVKQLVNYYIKPTKRGDILAKVLSCLSINEVEIVKNFYINKEQISEMIEGGMAIGNHGHSHTLFSNMSLDEQAHEIKTSLVILDNLTDGNYFNGFCYPYGGKHSYNKDTLSCLVKYGFNSAISVESRDINTKDLANKFEIPRYDCNEFKYGQATLGL